MVNQDITRVCFYQTPPLEVTTISGGINFSIFSRVNHFRINKKPSQKREEWDKHGKYKYIIHRINEAHRDLRAVQVSLWYMIEDLEHEFTIDREYVEDLFAQTKSTETSSKF